MRLEARLQEARAQAPMRLARHYAELVREVADIYEQGGDNSVAALIEWDAERAQIERWWEWFAERAADSGESARLLVDMTRVGEDILALRLPSSELVRRHQRALESARQIDDTAAAADHLRSLAAAFMGQGDLKQARESVGQSCALAERHDHPQQLADALLRLSNLEMDGGDLDACAAASERARAICRQLGDLRGTGQALSMLGWVAVRKGQWEAAEAYLQESYAILLRVGDQVLLARNLNMHGTLARMLGHYDRAQALHTQSMELSLRLGNQKDTLNNMMALATVFDNQGDFSAAQDYYLQALQIARRLGEGRAQAVVYGNLGYSAYLQGQFADAVRYSEEALALLHAQKNFMMMCVAYANVIPAYLPLGRYEEARQALLGGLELAISIGAEPSKVMMMVAAVQTWAAAALAKPDAAAQREMMAEAASWSGMILACPGAEQENRDEVEKLRPQMEAALGAERFMALFQEGGKGYIDDVIADIVSVLRASA